MELEADTATGATVQLASPEDVNKAVRRMGLEPQRSWFGKYGMVTVHMSEDHCDTLLSLPAERSIGGDGASIRIQVDCHAGGQAT